MNRPHCVYETSIPRPNKDTDTRRRSTQRERCELEALVPSELHNWDCPVTAPASQQTFWKTVSRGIRRVLVILAIAIVAVSTKYVWRVYRLRDILRRFNIAKMVRTEVLTKPVPVDSHVGDPNLNGNYAALNGEFAPMGSVTLARRSHRSIPQRNEEIDSDMNFVVLDTEGLLYSTNFSRNVHWVARLTDNLLNVKKPVMHEPQETYALNNVPTADESSYGVGNDKSESDSEGSSRDSGDMNAEEPRRTNTRHLVPSYDGYVYCVYENGHSQLLHIHVRDIVNFTPFKTPLLDGVYLEGTRSSSVLALDFDTGTYIERGPINDDGSLPSNHVATAKTKQCNKRQLHIGYTDWTVRAYDEKSHDQLWSFNWREIGAVNSETTRPAIVDRVREAITIDGKMLIMRSEDEDGTFTEYMNFPFQITALFAVVWNAKTDILTLQLVERIAVPPPPAFLQNILGREYVSLKLTSSSFFGTNKLSVNNGVINVQPRWDEFDEYVLSGGYGRLIEIKVVDPQHYYMSEARLQPLSITQKEEDDWETLKWKYVIRAWAILFWLAALLFVRRGFKDSRPMRLFHEFWFRKLPITGVLIERFTRFVMDVERWAFEYTERLIYNVDRFAPMHSVTTLCETFTVPVKLLNHLGELHGFALRGIGSQKEKVENTSSTRIEETSHTPPSVNVDSTVNYADVPEIDKSKEEELQSISVVPRGTALADFLENGRFLRTFDCIKLLGKGGFGSVYRAQHKLEPGNPTYAVKLVLLKLKASEGLTSKRYFREIVANREISSKYVVRYFTWWCEEPHFLPLTQLTAEIQSAAATNVKHLIGTTAIDAQRSTALTAFMQQYQEMLREIMEKSSEDSVFNTSNISLMNSGVEPRARNKRLRAIGENSYRSRVGSDESDSMLNGVHVYKFEYEESNDVIEYNESSQGVVFEYSEVSQQPNNIADEMQLRELSAQNHNKHESREKETEKSYPVVLLILMELCKGCTLREWLNRPERSDKPMHYTLASNGVPVEFDLFRQLIKGLRDIHANNFIHRDLKPENVFVDPDTHAVKIGDFGLVGFISQTTHDTPLPQNFRDVKQGEPLHHQGTDRSPPSVPGHIIGTPGYTAPEGGFHCSEKADIYSAALILLELLSPRFNTVMERLAVLDTFRKSSNVPDFIATELRPWHDLLIEMGSKTPELRPSAVEIQKRLKVIMANWNGEPSH
ncbi:Eukaryotic translation initiation factor 2-alpha kinase 1 [Babesia sp. Xinjiang]|uniref:Eukaryotic translation initiation factor 2-alpha kinase 1 n=1 Tax=Babesia sp. Xinjiang TaxID=462227 RepID=UPI000A21FBBC|nr:Eukaryotic translation initiation factor 2-alpha kinase 1 [Babesia sp. Xinjiang]ORM39360.1 Eukaryotic translation initiation factor 2-alpha kinase 1 [Babesia sp. Xinjiang]